MPFTAEQRAELRAAVDQSKREALAESAARSRASRQPQLPPTIAEGRPKTSAVVRAAEHARRAQDARGLAAAVVVERPTTATYCRFCGAHPVTNGVCPSHEDLVESHEPNPASTAIGSGSSTEGV